MPKQDQTKHVAELAKLNTVLLAVVCVPPSPITMHHFIFKHEAHTANSHIVAADVYRLSKFRHLNAAGVN